MKSNWQSVMKIVCAWCGANMGEKDGEGTEGITSSICRECFEIVKPRRDQNVIQK